MYLGGTNDAFRRGKIDVTACARLVGGSRVSLVRVKGTRKRDKVLAGRGPMVENGGTGSVEGKRSAPLVGIMVVRWWGGDACEPDTKPS